MSDTKTPAPPADEPASADTTPAETSQPVDESKAGTQTNEAPEATQDNAQAQEAQAPETKAEETAEERLYAGKYKTVEDLEGAYKNASSEASRISQERAELAKILNDAFIQPESPAQPQVGQEEYQDENQPDPQQDLTNRKLATMEFLYTHGDANGEDMNKVLREDPHIQQISDYSAKLEYAYLKSKNMSSSKAIEEAQRKGAEQAQAKTAEKQAAQVETAKQKAQPTEGDNELSQSELRSALSNDKSFDDLISKKFPGISKMRSK